MLSGYHVAPPPPFGLSGPGGTREAGHGVRLVRNGRLVSCALGVDADACCV